MNFFLSWVIRYNNYFIIDILSFNSVTMSNTIPDELRQATDGIASFQFFCINKECENSSYNCATSWKNDSIHEWLLELHCNKCNTFW